MDGAIHSVSVSLRALWLPIVAMFSVLVLGFGYALDGWAATGASLKIVVYGATGRVGTRVVAEALSRGHQVTAVSRDSARVTQQHDNLSAVLGDILEPENVASIIADQDVIVVSIRGSVDNSRDPEKAVQYVAAKVLVGVLRGMGDGAPRLIYVGGAGSLEVEPGVLYADSIPAFMRFVMPPSMRQEIRGHILTLTYLRTVDDLQWTYISPARKFSRGERTGTFRIGGDLMLEDEKGRSIISMEDFSIALIDEAENSEHAGERFSVAY